MENHNLELQSLVLEIAKQNILLGQRIDTLALQQGQFSQRMDAQGQRIDTLAQQVAQQQKEILEQQQRSDKLLAVVVDVLQKLPDVVKDQIGFKAK